MSLLRFNDETVTASLHPSRDGPERGKSYRVTFEEIGAPTDFRYASGSDDQSNSSLKSPQT